MWQGFLLGLVVGVAISCQTMVPVLIECEDPPEEAMQQIDQLPDLWFDWYWNVYDPRCEAIYDAIHE